MPYVVREFAMFADPWKAGSFCPLQELPLELCYSVIGFLDSDGLRALSHSSKFWYHLLFPMRIRGLRISCRYKRQLGDLERFGDGRSFAPLRRHIKYLKIEPGNGIVNLHRSIGLLSAFTDITTVVIRTKRNLPVARNLYVAIISCLSTLLFYDDIERMEFICNKAIDEGWAFYTSEDQDEQAEIWSTRESSDLFNSQRQHVPGTGSPGLYARNPDRDDSDSSDLESAYPVLSPNEERTRRDFFYKLRETPRRMCKFLGRFVSENAFSRLVTTGKVRLPRGLRFFKIDREGYQSSYCLPLMFCRNLTALYTGVGDCDLIKDVRRPDKLLKFPNIKALELSCGRSFHGSVFSEIATQFPNLTSLTVTAVEAENFREAIYIPNLPKLEYLHVPVIYWGTDSGSETLKKMEDKLMQRINNGEFPALKRYKVSGIRVNYGHIPDYGEATGAISSGIDPEYDRVCLKFEWIEDRYGVEFPEDTDLDRLWDSGLLFKDVTQDGDGLEEAEESQSEIEELETDESIYDSEEERIEIDRRREVKAEKRSKARERRRRIICEERRWAERDDSRDEILNESSQSQRYKSDDEEEGDDEEGENKKDDDEKEEDERKGPLLPYVYMDFENTTAAIDADSETSSLAEVEGEEADDEIGHTASQYLSLAIDGDEHTFNPEDSDEYEELEIDENDTQETLDGFEQDPQFDIPPNNCRWEEENNDNNTQYESQYSQFDTQEYLANAANMAQEPQYPKPGKSINLTMDPREVEKIRNKNLYRR
ncbi:hypothetical protein TWF506_004638 [Arthrobotrys conoides]|uniref:F-box domain-containing protein n=1 Tax=Arthrobotrys conoides TaxID=74498 RepID=A0AAN8RP00_9PEZI